MLKGLVEICSVKIICDGWLKKKVIDGVMAMGAGGYTWMPAYGKGRKEIMTDIYGGLDRLYLETWCSNETALKIIDYFEGPQFSSQAMSIAASPLFVPESESKKYS